MTDYEFVCHECGRTFRGLTSRIGEEMCPACGSSDIDFASASCRGAGRPRRPSRLARGGHRLRRRLTRRAVAGAASDVTLGARAAPARHGGT